MVSSNQPRVKQTRLQFCHEKELESSLRLYLSRLNFQRFEYCEADLNWSRILSGGAIIFVVILSAYFGAVAAAPIPNAVGQPLAIYELDSGGHLVASMTNVFEAGQMIWVSVPNGISPPYTLTMTSLSGFTVFSQQNNTFPANGLISVSLAHHSSLLARFSQLLSMTWSPIPPVSLLLKHPRTPSQ